MSDDDLRAAATRRARRSAARASLTIATAESCTGGLVAGALTEIAGSSDVVDRGFVTYSNEAKQQMLGVPADTLRDYRRGQPRDRRGDGARRARQGQAPISSVAITGIAGPGGGSADKPVGLVHFAAASRGGALMHAETRYGDIGRAGCGTNRCCRRWRCCKEMAETCSCRR